MYRVKMLIASVTAVVVLSACGDVAGVSRSTAEAPVRLDGAPAVISSSPPPDSTAAINDGGTLGSGYSVSTNGNGTLGSGY
jgi:hypothetical protein